MFDKKDKEIEAARAEDMRVRRELLRDVFTSEKGAMALSLILDDLHYFDPRAGAEYVPLVNYAKDLLAQIGTGNGYEMTRAIIMSGRQA